jgi:hypothetical protein
VKAPSASVWAAVRIFSLSVTVQQLARGTEHPSKRDQTLISGSETQLKIYLGPEYISLIFPYTVEYHLQ